MSASFASARMKACERRLARISASLASRDFMCNHEWTRMNTNQNTIRSHSSFVSIRGSLHLRQDLVRDGLNGGLGFGVIAGAGFCCCRHRARHAGTPFAIVAEFTFFEAVARVGNAEALLDLEKILKLGRGKRVRRFAQLR